MAKPPNPFAGISLTDQTPMRQAGHDQRLFSSRPAAPAVEEPATAPTEPPAERAPKAARKQAAGKARTQPQSAEPTEDSTVSGHQEATTPRYRDTTVSSWSDEWVTAATRLLRRPGKESATLRLTTEEKAQLRDLAYTYTRQGRRTTETELIRIAIHALLEDYQAHGESSALARVMTALEP